MRNMSIILNMIAFEAIQKTLKGGLWHGQKWLHSFVDSEAYHEQMGPTPSQMEA